MTRYYASECSMSTRYYGLGCHVVTRYYISECQILAQYYRIRLSHSYMVILNQDVTFRHLKLKRKTYWISLMYTITKKSIQKDLGLKAWVLVCDLNIVDWYVLTLVLLTLLHVVCCFPYTKFHSWFYTIILCILVTIWVSRWYPLSTHCLLLSHTFVFLYFSFVEFTECTNDFQI